MGGSWEFGQEANVAVEEEEPPSCGRSQGKGQRKVHSPSQAGQGWQGPLEVSWPTSRPRAVTCCATLWDVTVSYTGLCYAVRIILFSLYFLLSSE